LRYHHDSSCLPDNHHTTRTITQTALVNTITELPVKCATCKQVSSAELNFNRDVFLTTLYHVFFKDMVLGYSTWSLIVPLRDVVADKYDLCRICAGLI